MKWRHISLKMRTYRAMIINVLVHAFHGNNVNCGRFWQYGTICRASYVTIVLLCETIDGSLISRNGDVNWPSSSCDLTPFEYFLWGAIKEKYYADKPEIIELLNSNIRDAIVEMWSHTLVKVHCEAKCGSHMNEIVFHF